MKPTVWRAIHVHEDATFQELHNVIQLLFDWWDAYPYHFIISNDQTLSITKQGENYDASPDRKTFDRDTAINVPLAKQFRQIGDKVNYEYGSATCWELAITLHKRNDPLSDERAYPLCIDAGNELLHKSKNEKEAVLFPFGKQKALQHENLVNRLNNKISDNIIQLTTLDMEIYTANCWDRLHKATEQYYKYKPWKTLTNQQVFAIYDERFDEFIFCSVLGKDEEMYGLSVYIGFNGLLSLHTSLTKNLSIEQLFQLHANLLLQFEKKNKKRKQHYSSPASFFANDEVSAQFTSYKPGYFPWKIDKKEAAMFILAIEMTLYIYEKAKAGYPIPNYIEKDELLLLSVKNDSLQVTKTVITFEQIVKKLLPLQVTISDAQFKQLSKVKRVDNVTVEFSLQYVNVPIQRLKDNRPFLPLSSVITNAETGQIIYHNIYNARLDYSIVQAEFVHMIHLLDVLPGCILTDELTYHYLKPLLIVEDFPIQVKADLRMTKQINENVSHYLLTRAE